LAAEIEVAPAPQVCDSVREQWIFFDLNLLLRQERLALMTGNDIIKLDLEIKHWRTRDTAYYADIAGATAQVGNVLHESDEVVPWRVHIRLSVYLVQVSPSGRE
jgi:hypothetical protein